MDPREKEMPKNRARPTKYTGACFVVKDNIDTDQIIPAEYLTLVPSKVGCRAVGLSLPFASGRFATCNTPQHMSRRWSFLFECAYGCTSVHTGILLLLPAFSAGDVI